MHLGNGRIKMCKLPELQCTEAKQECNLNITCWMDQDKIILKQTLIHIKNFGKNYNALANVVSDELLFVKELGPYDIPVFYKRIFFSI